MGFLKKLFGRKPRKNGGRGTRIGNLLRDMAYDVSGGLIGEDMGSTAQILLYGSAKNQAEIQQNGGLTGGGWDDNL